MHRRAFLFGLAAFPTGTATLRDEMQKLPTRFDLASGSLEAGGVHR